jgi:hypothetical protein
MAAKTFLLSSSSGHEDGGHHHHHHNHGDFFQSNFVIIFIGLKEFALKFQVNSGQYGFLNDFAQS